MFSSHMLQPQQIVETWTKLAGEQLARMTEFSAQMTELQTKALERSFEVIDESARLMKETLSSTAKLSDDWRKIALENSERAAKAMAPEVAAKA